MRLHHRVVAFLLPINYRVNFNGSHKNVIAINPSTLDDDGDDDDNNGDYGDGSKN